MPSASGGGTSTGRTAGAAGRGGRGFGAAATGARGGWRYGAAGGAGRDRGSYVIANRWAVGSWEQFTVVEQYDGYVALRAHNGWYVSADLNLGGKLVLRSIRIQSAHAMAQERTLRLHKFDMQMGAQFRKAPTLILK